MTPQAMEVNSRSLGFASVPSMLSLTTDSGDYVSICLLTNFTIPQLMQLILFRLRRYPNARPAKLRRARRLAARPFSLKSAKASLKQAHTRSWHAIANISSPAR